MSSTVFFISDLHLGHKRILDFSPCRGGSTVDEHDEWIIEQYNSVVKKRDVVYILGDIAFSREGLEKVKRFNGNKIALLGNHDNFRMEEYLAYFPVKPSLYKYKGMWLSHAPTHNQELRGLPNIHGHTHDSLITINYTDMDTNTRKEAPDPRYINVCVEQLNGIPISLEEIKARC